MPFAIISNVVKLIIGIPVESFYSVLEWVFEILIVTIVVFALYGIGIALYAHVNPINLLRIYVYVSIIL